MPMVLKHIDTIAREVQRDVLFVSFEEYRPTRAGEKPNESAPRNQILSWLSENEYSFSLCFGLECSGMLTEAYKGQIYIDQVFDVDCPRFKKLESFFENSDGTSSFNGAQFMYLPLKIAMERGEQLKSVDYDEEWDDESLDEIVDELSGDSEKE